MCDCVARFPLQAKLSPLLSSSLQSRHHPFLVPQFPVLLSSSFVLVFSSLVFSKLVSDSPVSSSRLGSSIGLIVSVSVFFLLSTDAAHRVHVTAILRAVRARVKSARCTVADLWGAAPACKLLSSTAFRPPSSGLIARMYSHHGRRCNPLSCSRYQQTLSDTLHFHLAPILFLLHADSSDIFGVLVTLTFVRRIIILLFSHHHALSIVHVETLIIGCSRHSVLPSQIVLGYLYISSTLRS